MALTITGAELGCLLLRERLCVSLLSEARNQARFDSIPSAKVRHWHYNITLRITQLNMCHETNTLIADFVGIFLH